MDGKHVPFSKYCCQYLLLVSLLACSSANIETGDYSFQISTVDGVIIAETKNGPKYSDPLFSLEEVARIQEDVSNEDTLLAQPRWMGIDEEGMIYVFDGVYSRHESRLIVYHPDGTFSHVIGRGGRGPGEYMYPKLVSTREGTVTIFEPSLRRLSQFSRTGTFQRLFTSTPGDALPDVAYLDDHDKQIIIYSTRTDRWSSQQAVTYSIDGVELGLIESPRVPRHDGMRFREGLWNTPSQFCGRAMMGYSPLHGIMYTDGNEAAVKWYDLSGELKKVFDFGMASGPVSESDRELADSYFRNLWLDGNPLGADLYNAWIKEDNFPKFRAFWNDFSIDEYGYLWLEDPSSQFSATERFLRVVSPEGEYLGNCTLPQGEGKISNGHYLLIDRDLDSDEWRLIVYKLIPTLEGLNYPN
ncbi:6-bladed beta-propeller [Gemmatimonadota bacterium]